MCIEDGFSSGSVLKFHLKYNKDGWRSRRLEERKAGGTVNNKDKIRVKIDKTFGTSLVQEIC